METDQTKEFAIANSANKRTSGEKVHVIACGAIAREILAVSKLNELDHIELTCLPAIWHAHPQKIAPGLEAAIADVDMAEMAITSDLVIAHGDAPAGAFTLDDVKGVAVVVEKAEDRGLKRCARSWRYTADVGQDAEFPDVSARDAAVLHELKALGRL